MPNWRIYIFLSRISQGFLLDYFFLILYEKEEHNEQAELVLGTDYAVGKRNANSFKEIYYLPK